MSTATTTRRPSPMGDVQSNNPPAPDKPEARRNFERDPATPVEPVRNPNSREPSEEEKSKLDRLHSEQDRRLDAVFRGDDLPEPAKAPPPEPPAAPPEPPAAPPAADPPKADPPEEPKETEGEDINFDKPPAGAVTGRERESMAQISARENGRALKELNVKHNEMLLEMNRVKEELELAKKAGTPAPTRREDYLSHPEVNPLRQEVIQDIRAVAEVQPTSEAGKLLAGRFGVYMTSYMAKNAAADEEEAQALDAELRATLKDDFREMYKETNGVGYDQAEMDRGAQDYSREVLQLLVRNAGRTRQIEEKIGSLVHKAREGTLAQNVDVYAFHEGDLGKAIDAIPSIPDDVIEENPFTVEATIAKLVKQDAWKERYQVTRKQVLELLLGPRVLSQKEIDDMQTGGIDVKKFYKDRQKSWLDRRKKLAVSITQSLLLRGIWEQTARDAEASRASNTELDAFSKARPKENGSSPAPAPPKRLGTEFLSSIEDHLREIERY